MNWYSAHFQLCHQDAAHCFDKVLLQAHSLGVAVEKFWQKLTLVVLLDAKEISKAVLGFVFRTAFRASIL